jgi:molybdopterin-guanine dinucleotide biosynthesis protein A
MTDPLLQFANVQWDAIVLAGGRSSRLGGVDKTALRFEGMSLLDHALAAVAGARRAVVVGPGRLRDRVGPGVEVVTEHPRFGGPAAATAAGMAALGVDAPPRVAVLAADLPFAREALDELLAAGGLGAEVDGVVAGDQTGRIQPLLAVYDSAALTRAATTAGDLTHASMRSLIGGMRLRPVRILDGLCADIDTPLAAEQHGIMLEPDYADV